MIYPFTKFEFILFTSSRGDYYYYYYFLESITSVEG